MSRITAAANGAGPSRRAVLGGAGLLGLALALSACAGPTGKREKANTLTLALNRSLVSLDNKLNQFDAAVTVQRAVRQGLTAIGEDLQPKMVLAQFFEATGDTEWTVQLNPKAVYSDGSPVTVEDVKVALEMYQKVEGSFVAPQFPEFPTVKDLGSGRFVLASKEPIVALPWLMSNILITPAAANKAAELSSGVGSGPYVVKDADPGTGNYTLDANPNYWAEPKPSIGTVYVRFTPEESSRVTALRTGDVDVIDSITSDSATQLQGWRDVQVESVVGTRYNHFFFNFRKPSTHPLSDPAVRKALTYAVDGNAIAQGIMSGSVTPASGVVPQTLIGWAETGNYVYDPGKARDELAKLGADKLELNFIWESGEFASDAATMEALVEMFKQVGVSVKLQQFEPGGDISKWRRGEAGDWDVLGNGYGNQTGLALTTLQGMYATTAEMEKTRDSYHGFIVPEVSSLIRRASSEGDENTRNQLLATAQKKVWDLTPSLWAFIPNAVLAQSNLIKGMALTPINSYDLAKVSRA
ncbi:MAG: ABC transporter substrate-binding protein [Arthrobacter sp.]|jgi:peptide/nickel transport system substrate-binding protein|nr:ABC transporter substrate-binding protein [Arthrobacter sp.]